MKRKMSISRAKQIDRTERNAAENILKKLSVDKLEFGQDRTRKFSSARMAQKPDRGSFRGRSNAIRIKKPSLPTPGTQPMNVSNIVTWFKDFEVPKGVGRELDGTISLWFHGK